MLRNRGIAFKLALLILSCTVAILALVQTESYEVSKHYILKSVEENARNLASSTVYKIETVLASVQKVSENIAFSLENAQPSRDEVIRLVQRVVARNHEIYGAGIAFEPFAMDPYSLFFCPYAHRSGDLASENETVELTFLGGAGYRYFYRDWYQLPKELGRAVWSEPYFDEGGGNTIMTTHSVPFYNTVDGQRVFRGVVGADMDLGWLQDIITSVKIFKTGYAFLISRQGTFLVHPERRLMMNETIFSLAEEKNDPRLREIGKAMTRGESALVEFICPTTGKDAYLYYLPLPTSGWSLGVVIPRDELMADVTRLNQIMLGTGAAGFVLLFIVIVVIARSITKPLARLNRAARRIASGNLDAPVPDIKGGDEVAQLAKDFAQMRNALRDFIKELKETTRSKERIESELRIAREIQMGILPKIFPPFPERGEFDLYASIEPAREVGGDLYDFFFVDENTFCFLIGDVSGKGVPAAFFMAVTKTLLKVTAERGLDPGAVLSKVNDDLAAENDSCMFVTLFCACIDLPTGTVKYASAGHNPPVLLPASGAPSWLPPRNEPVAGAMEGMVYTTDTLTLGPGDALFFYTDGVTEAMNHKEELYSDPRLMDLLGTLGGQSPKELVTTVNASIKAFTGGAEQSDDITMLALRYLGRSEETR